MSNILHIEFKIYSPKQKHLLLVMNSSDVYQFKEKNFLLGVKLIEKSQEYIINEFGNSENRGSQH